MDSAQFVWRLLILLVVAVLIFGWRWRSGIEDDSFRPRLQGEVSRMPTYSAETTNGKEAEFIRDRLPKRFPTILLLVFIVVLSVFAWWFAR